MASTRITPATLAGKVPVDRPGCIVPFSTDRRLTYRLYEESSCELRVTHPENKRVVITNVAALDCRQ